MELVVPDAITTAIILMVGLFGLSLALGATLTTTMDAYYRGLWNLLAFTMQMTLILVLSLILAATPVFKRAIVDDVASADHPGASRGSCGAVLAHSSPTSIGVSRSRCHR